MNMIVSMQQEGGLTVWAMSAKRVQYCALPNGEVTLHLISPKPAPEKAVSLLPVGARVKKEPRGNDDGNMEQNDEVKRWPIEYLLPANEIGDIRDHKN